MHPTHHTCTAHTHLPRTETPRAACARRPWCAAVRGGNLAVAAGAAVTSLIVTGCSQPRATPQPEGTPRQVSSPSEPVSVAPRAGQWPSQVQARVGQPVMIRMPGTAGTGFTWQLASPVCDVLPLAFSQQLETSKDGRVGGPSEWVFTFTAGAPGSCPLTFVYHRPWERGVAPAETRSITVEVIGP
ncbi:MAG: hypothetical protein FGM37_05385 [Phycisphaerales bacterium]|nr:hypothetical protein [Phycisphaerales bacterium]